jgi:DUF971 family protein
MHTASEVTLAEDGIHLRWDDGHLGFYPHRHLRAECRCAACINEFTGERMIGYDNIPEDVETLEWMEVGRYALRFLFSDFHDTGIYPFDLLRSVCLCPEHAAERAARAPEGS